MPNELFVIDHGMSADSTGAIKRAISKKEKNHDRIQ